MPENKEKKEMKFSRRSFMKISASSLMLASASSATSAQSVIFNPPRAELGTIRSIKGYCPFCQARCTYNGRVISTKEGDKLHDIVGDADNRWTGGAMCPKGLSIVELINSPHRITEPMVKTDKGWKTISYQEAVDMVAQRLLDIRKEHGENISSRIALTSPLWDCRESELAALMTMRLTGGINIMPAGEVCISSASNTLSMLLGANTSTTTVNEILNSKLLILWGANLAELYPPYSRWLDMAKEKGVEIIYIDCRKTHTSKWCSSQIMPYPGTDGAIVLGAIKYLLDNNLTTMNYPYITEKDKEDIRKTSSKYDLQFVAETSGVKEEDLIKIYKAIAQSPSTILWMGGAISRYTNGISTIRSMITLQAITGNLIGSGKGVLTMEGGKPEGEKEFVDHMCGENPKIGMNFRRLRSAMDKGTIDLLFLNSSYRRYPDAGAVKEALKNVPFIVHYGFFMTEETEACHLFLPATFSPESQGSHYGAEKQVVWRDKMFDAPGSCKPCWEFYRDVGVKMFPDKYPNFKDPEELYTMFTDVVPSWKGMTLDRVKKSADGLVWPIYEENGKERIGSQFDHNHLHTEDGKFVFTPPVFGALNWVLPKDSPLAPKADDEYPLFFIQGKLVHHWHQTLTNFSESLSQFSNGRYFNIHPNTAKKLGLKTGDMAMLETPTGSVEGRIEEVYDILEDAVFTPSHLSSSSPFKSMQSQHINFIIPNNWDRISAQFNGTGCRLVKKA